MIKKADGQHLFAPVRTCSSLSRTHADDSPSSETLTIRPPKTRADRYEAQQAVLRIVICIFRPWLISEIIQIELPDGTYVDGDSV